MEGIDLNLIRNALISFVILLGSLCVHEWAHAFIADKLGDPTPGMDGRLTLNPASHIDLFGTILFPFLCFFFLHGRLLFGWARPVMTNPSYFKHRARDSMIVAAAGPMSNFGLAFLAAVAGRFLFTVEPSTVELFGRVVLINVVLAVFNLLPIPPLDGSHLMRHMTGMSDETFLRLSQWGGLILLAIWFIPFLNQLVGQLISIGLIPFVVIYPQGIAGFFW